MRAKLMRSSAVHDALYDWMRLKKIERDPYRPTRLERITTQGWLNRLVADTLFYLISRADGRGESGAEDEWKTLRRFGRAPTHNEKIDCPRPHARAVAPATIDVSPWTNTAGSSSTGSRASPCAPPTTARSNPARWRN